MDITPDVHVFLCVESNSLERWPQTRRVYKKDGVRGQLFLPPLPRDSNGVPKGHLSIFSYHLQDRVNYS